MTPVANAQAAASEYGYRAASDDLAFRKQVYQDSLPRQQQLMNLAQQVVQQQMGIMDFSKNQAESQWNDYQNVWRPNELNTMADAYGQSYLGGADRAQLNQLLTGGGGLSDADRMTALQGYSGKAENAAATQAMTRAAADVNSAFAQQARGLTRMGGDPNRMAAAAAQLGSQQALAKVGAANQAREGARGQMLGLRSGVANFGRNMPNTAGQAFGLSAQAGNSAVANQNQAFMSGLPYAQFQAGGTGNQLGAAGLAQQGALGMGGLMNQSYAAQAQQYGAGMAGLGQLAGMMGYGMIFGGGK